MTSRRIVPLLLLILASSGVTSCRALGILLVSGATTDCGTETDESNASGVVRDANGVAVADARAVISRRPDADPNGLLVVQLYTSRASSPSPLTGHVTGARLLARSGQVLLELPLPTAPQPVTSNVLLNGYRYPPSDSAYLFLRDELLTGQARVVVHSDLPGLEHLSALLPTTIYSPPRRKRCPFS